MLEQLPEGHLSARKALVLVLVKAYHLAPVRFLASVCTRAKLQALAYAYGFCVEEDIYGAGEGEVEEEVTGLQEHGPTA